MMKYAMACAAFASCALFDVSKNTINIHSYFFAKITDLKLFVLWTVRRGKDYHYMGKEEG